MQQSRSDSRGSHSDSIFFVHSLKIDNEQREFVRFCTRHSEDIVNRRLPKAEYDFIVFDNRGNFLVIQAKRSAQNNKKNVKQNLKNAKAMIDYFSEFLGNLQGQNLRITLMLLIGSGPAKRFQIFNTSNFPGSAAVSEFTELQDFQSWEVFWHESFPVIEPIDQGIKRIDQLHQFLVALRCLNSPHHNVPVTFPNLTGVQLVIS